MDTLRIVSLMSDNQIIFCEQLTFYLGQRLGITAELITEPHWQEREHLLDTGDVQVGWICGLQFARKRLSNPDHLELLAAPVMSNPRYGQRPVYFSDVIVHSDSPFTKFEQLRDTSWAFNEPGSHSGVNIVRQSLANMGNDERFFGRAIETGSHLNAIDAVVNGLADWAAIDSTAFDVAVAEKPVLRQSLRVIAQLGPSPMPPLVVTTAVPATTRHAMRSILLGMENCESGRTILSNAYMLKMATVWPEDYMSLVF